MCLRDLAATTIYMVVKETFRKSGSHGRHPYDTLCGCQVKPIGISMNYTKNMKLTILPYSMIFYFFLLQFFILNNIQN